MKAKSNMEYAPNLAPTASSQSASTGAAEHAARAKAASPEMADAIAKGYEPHDIGVRGIAIFLAVLAATVVVVLAFIYFLMFGLINFQHSGELKTTPLVITNPPQRSPLQPSVEHNLYDHDDMLQMRIDTMAILNSGGTTFTGRKHIPISDAIDLVLSKLPTRP